MIASVPHGLDDDTIDEITGWYDLGWYDLPEIGQCYHPVISSMLSSLRSYHHTIPDPSMISSCNQSMVSSLECQF
jgi:hypothetical protein